MIIYRTEQRRMATRDLFAEIRKAPSARDALIGFGELESGLCDLLPVQGIRHAALACGRWFCGSERARFEFESALDALERVTLPQEVPVSLPEGYAYYGLYPESYMEAAREFVRELRPAHAAVIGIRTIGTSLSAAAGGALLECGVPVSSWTVRPTGHPFDRILKVRERIRTAWSTLSRSAHFAVVDEGPGLSGSSFLSVIRALRECGVPDERIVLFPSWVPEGGELANEQARLAWRRHRKFSGNWRPALPSGHWEDLSAGRWREKLNIAVPVNPRHEALKFLSKDGRLLKFSGLGRYGTEKLETAKTLAEAGYSPRPHGLMDGFMEFDYVPGHPLSAAEASPAFLRFMADYLGFRAEHLRAQARSLGFDQLVEMVEFNAQRSFPELRQYRREFEDRPAVHVDGSMMPHEWIETSRGWLKTDSIDHSRDHFFPGRADPLWDVAGAFVEFGLNQDQRQYLLRRYQETAPDHFSPGLVRFFEIAYLAFRFGYASMSGHAFDGQRRDYAARLGIDMDVRQVIA